MPYKNRKGIVTNYKFSFIPTDRNQFEIDIDMDDIKITKLMWM